MSLRDRLRGALRGSDEDDAVAAGGGGGDGGSASGDGLSAGAELSEFAPRQDGEYLCAERGLHLRFVRPTVLEVDAALAEPAQGEFTPSGRFSVQRRFGRPIVFTVLPDTAGYDESLTVRRTDTETRDAERLTYAFVAD